MIDLKQQALTVAVLAALGERITKAAEKARADLRDQMLETATERVAAKLAGGLKVGSVTLAGSSGGRAYITDEAAFTRYIQDKHPGEMEYTVRPSFRKRLLDEISATAEIVPGVALSEPRPYLMNTFVGGGKDAVAAAWADGELRELLGGLLEIEGGEES